MAQTSSVFLIVVLFYCVATESHAQDVPSNTGRKESNMFKSFLKSLANINHDRLDTVKKLAKLHNPNVMNVLRGGASDVDENARRLLAVVLMNRTAQGNPEQSEQSTIELQSEINDDVNIKPEGYDDVTKGNEANEDLTVKDVTSEMGGLDENNVAQENMDSIKDRDNLKMWKGCNKKAAKICKKACISAHRNVCARLTCSKKVTKALKKECKSSCKSSFL